MTLRTIHPIGKKPVTAPSTVARNARPDGMVKMEIATRLATMSATMAAICAFTLLVIGRDEHQQRDDRQGRSERRQNPVVEGIVNLVPHNAASLGAYLCR